MDKEKRLVVHVVISAMAGIATTFITKHFVNVNLAMDLGAAVIFSAILYHLMFLMND